jgi:monoamine oxidase
MARTPLVDVLRRAAAIARHARTTGEPLDEAIARDRELRVDAARRRFLTHSAAASAALLLPACVRTPSRAAHADEVVIVGAGVAGLMCAYRLRQAGVAVRVYEAQERIG